MGRTLTSLYTERITMKNIFLLSILTLAILQPLAEAQKEKGTTISVSNHLNTGTRLSMNCNLTLDQSSCSTTTREFPNIPNGETSQITDKNPNCAVTGINCIAIGKGQEACTRFYPGFNMFDVKTANRGKGCYYKDANHDLEGLAKPMSLDDATNEVIKASNNECSKECSSLDAANSFESDESSSAFVTGSRECPPPPSNHSRCNICLAAAAPSAVDVIGTCQPKEQGFGCWPSCLLSSVRAITYCRRRWGKDYLKFFACIRKEVNPKCWSCACSLACKANKRLCRFCRRPTTF